MTTLRANAQTIASTVMIGVFPIGDREARRRTNRLAVTRAGSPPRMAMTTASTRIYANTSRNVALMACVMP